jgi:predicted RNase H-like HicB family nuclease
MKTYYIAAFIPSEDGGFEIVIPDIPNCFTSADTLELAFDSASRELSQRLSEMVENKEPVPEPTSLEEVMTKTAQLLHYLEHQPAGEIHYHLIFSPNLEDALVRVTITISKSILESIDNKAKIYGLSRSGFISAAIVAYRQGI